MLRARGIVADQRRDVIDDLAHVATRRLGSRGRAKIRKSERIRLRRRASFLTTPERVRALLAGERLLDAEQGGRVDDGGQRIPDLVGHARGELARRGQPLGLGEPRLEPLALRHVGDELEEEDLAVGLADRRSSSARSAGRRRSHTSRRSASSIVLAPLERAAGTGRAVGADDLVAAAVRQRAELRVHPAVGVADPEVAVDELEALAEAVDQALVELLERGASRCGRGPAPR